MFGKRITLFTVLGIRVGIDLSWIFLALLVAWSLAQGFFPMIHEGLPKLAYWWMGLAGVIGLFFSLVTHELMHSVVARMFGTPVRGITLFALGGVAEMEEEPGTPLGELLMALAGPLTSAVLALLFHLIGDAGGALGLPEPLLVVISYLAAINILLAVFNMVPAFPLDGGRVLRAILWKAMGDLERATRIAAAGGDMFGWLLIAVGALNAIQGSFIGGLWWVLIGFFVRAAARGTLNQQQARRLLKGLKVSRYMTTDPICVPPGMAVSELVEDHIYRHHFDLFPVVDGDRLIGCVGPRQVQGVPRAAWDRVSVGEIAVPSGPDNTIDADAELLDALAAMRRSGAGRLMVARQGQLAGIIVLKDLLELLALKLELEG